MTPHGRAIKCFLSYSHADMDAASELHGLLHTAGHEVFWDTNSIRPGAEWIDRLQSSLEMCQKFVILVGSSGVTEWLKIESNTALMLNRESGGRPEIYPVLLRNTSLQKLPLLLRLFQTVHWKPSDPLPEGLVAKTNTLSSNGLSLGIRPGQSPYRGLAPFGAKDGDIFFGRSRETLFALSKLGDQSARPTNPDSSAPLGTGGSYSRWLQIEGNSGCGKSSLVLGGMLPEIEGGGLWARTRIKHWRVLGPMMPGRTPFRTLAGAIRQCLDSSSMVEQPASSSSLIKEMRQASPDGVALTLCDAKQRGAAFLLILDQFEELITLAEDEERAEFDRQLARALGDRDCPLFMISTIRSDFLDRMERLPHLFAYYSENCQRYPLPTISKRGLHELIETRSRLANVDPDEVAAYMVDDAQEESGALPLVENALDILWREAAKKSAGGNNPDNPLRLSGHLYSERGRLAGLLSAGADELIAEIDKSLKGRGRTVALEVLLALTRVNPEGQHTRRRLSYGEAAMQGGKEGEHVLSMLAGEHPSNAPTENRAAVNRLVVVEGQRDVAGGGDARTVNLIHETLIRTRPVGGTQKPYWKTLYKYIEKHPDRDYLRQQVEWRLYLWQRATRPWRWRRLCYWASLWRFRQLRFPATSPEGIYLLASWRATGFATLLTAGVFALPIVLGALVTAWTAEHKFPQGYVALGLGWYVGLSSIPELLRVPPEAPLESGRPERGAAVAPFEIGAFEVTFEEYDYFVWSNRREPDPPKYPVDTYGGGRGRHPVINVSWDDAQRYVHWLSKKTGQDWRLPTGTQWEYAARAGDRSDGQPGGWQGPGRCYDCGGIADEKGPHAVGTYPKTAWGLFDVAGNVAEWVDDRITPEGPKRLIRGGGWIHERRDIGASAVADGNAHEPGTWIGFRVARFAAQPAVR